MGTTSEAIPTNYDTSCVVSLLESFADVVSTSHHATTDILLAAWLATASDGMALLQAVPRPDVELPLRQGVAVRGKSDDVSTDCAHE